MPSENQPVVLDILSRWRLVKSGLKIPSRCHFMSAAGKLKIWPYPVQMFEELEDLIIISYRAHSK